jgi:3-oxoacyl-(acyl-carrier-protein) synthase III
MAIKNPNPHREAKLLSIGAYRPARVVPNSELVERIDSSDEWIQQRTGIATRHWAGPEESLTDMAVEASKIAITRAGLTPADIDTIIFATITYPFQTPSASTDVGARLGIDRAAAFDVNAACAGFSYSVGLANDMVRAGTSTHVLVIGAEKISDFLDLDDRATSFIFADGAGAVVVGPSDHVGIGPTIMGSDVTNREAIAMEPSWLDYKPGANLAATAWPVIHQEGQKVFRWAVYEVAKVGNEIIAKSGLTPSDIAAFIPHQANERIIDSLAKSMELPDSVIIARDIRTTGNTSAASIPLAMDRLLQEHPELHGKNALLLGFGAGLVFSGQVVELPPAPQAVTN